MNRRQQGTLVGKQRDKYQTETTKISLKLTPIVFLKGLDRN